MISKGKNSQEKGHAKRGLFLCPINRDENSEISCIIVHRKYPVAIESQEIAILDMLTKENRQ